MLLIVLYDGVMLVRMNWYTGDSETIIHDDVISVLCMSGAMNNVLSDGRTVRMIIIPLQLPLLSLML